MKRIITIFLILVMVLGVFASCNKNTTPQTPPASDQIVDTGNQPVVDDGNADQAPAEDENSDENVDEKEDENLDENEDENGDEAENEEECEHEGGDDATCITESICDICDEPYGGFDSGNHEGDEEYETTKTAHKLVYSCCGEEVEAEEKHKFSEGVCTVCEYECEHASNNGHSCTACGAFVEHTYKNKVCAECGLTKNGKKVMFGSYPQSKVTTSSLITKLNSGASWQSSNGKWYADVENGGEKYRGVRTTQGGTATWFKYEPIYWTILEESNGKALLLCDMIIDCVVYSTSGSNSYEDSTIRAWLNEEFINTAFSDLQKEVIATTEVDNGQVSTGYGNPRFSGENTFDKLFLLSRAEVKNTAYGFTSDGSVEDSVRQRKATAYAIANGAYADANNGAWWWLRTPAPHTTDATRSDLAHTIKVKGTIHNATVGTATGGVLPAMWVYI